MRKPAEVVIISHPASGELTTGPGSVRARFPACMACETIGARRARENSMIANGKLSLPQADAAWSQASHSAAHADDASPQQRARAIAALNGFAAAWNTGSPDVRRRHLERVWSATGVFTDPTTHIVGRECLASYIARRRAEHVHGRWVPVGELDMHHRCLRFRWQWLDGAVPLLNGCSHGALDRFGRLRQVVAFFE